MILMLTFGQAFDRHPWPVVVGIVGIAFAIAWVCVEFARHA